MVKTSGGSKGVRGTPPGPNSFNFMQFLSFGENLTKLYVGAPPPEGWRPHLGEIQDPPLKNIPE